VTMINSMASGSVMFFYISVYALLFIVSAFFKASSIVPTM
jgi:hypothetical protein